MNMSSMARVCGVLILVAGAGCGGGGSDLVVDLGNGVSMPFVEIKPGRFMMGSPSNELGRGIDESQHEVTISEAFWLGQTEVTQAQWQAVMGSNPSYFKGDLNRPVDGVTWWDAQEFCRRLSQKTGMSFRLPTEAEWEYACRAGTQTAYSFGDEPSRLDGYAWFGTILDGNSDGTTHPVATKKPNAWGLYDMHGNVWEWCSDWYRDYPIGAVTDPQGPEIGTKRVLRGGARASPRHSCRASARIGSDPVYSDREGFRVARNPAEEARRAELKRKADAAFVKAGGVLELESGVSMRFAEIKPGTFMMGSPVSMQGRYDERPKEEVPQHEVTISEAFWLGQTEVTQAQWQAVMGSNPSFFKGDLNRPVEQVTWNDAQEFCLRLSQKTGMTFRLPTEAEWEYACRAGTTTAYSFGDDLRFLIWYSWSHDNSDHVTHPVATKMPNAWGLYDMHGNVWEWCSDRWDYYQGGPVTDPRGPAIGTSWVRRGGGWRDVSQLCRAASRRSGGPGTRINDSGLGFRVARTP